MSVCHNSGTLSIVLDLRPASYLPSLCSLCSIYWKYGKLFKLILKWPDFISFWGIFSGQIGNTVLCLEKHHKNERHLRLVTHIFTKPSQKVCPTNIHTFWYVYLTDVNARTFFYGSCKVYKKLAKFGLIDGLKTLFSVGVLSEFK